MGAEVAVLPKPPKAGAGVDAAAGVPNPPKAGVEAGAADPKPAAGALAGGAPKVKPVVVAGVAPAAPPPKEKVILCSETLMTTSKSTVFRLKDHSHNSFIKIQSQLNQRNR